MADSELGEVRRPQRSDLDRLLRATGYRSQGMAGGNTDTVSPLDESDDSGLTADGTSDDGDDTPDWHAEVINVTAATGAVVLAYVPVERSEVLRLNGVTMARDADYTVSGRTVTFVTPSSLLAGIGADTWTVEATYPYFDTAYDEVTITTVASAYVSPGVNTATLSGAVVAGQYGLLVAGGHMTGFTGGFATWTKVFGGTGYDEVALWLGVGVGSGTTVSHTATGAATDDAQFIIAVLDDVTSGVSIRSSASVALDATDDPAVSPTATAVEGELVACIIRGENDGTDSYLPDSTHTDTGFTGTYVANVKGVFYGQGVALSIGYATGTSVSTSFDMIVTGTNGTGEAATLILAVD